MSKLQCVFVLGLVLAAAVAKPQETVDSSSDSADTYEPCVTVSQVKGVCVPYYLCTEEQPGSDLIDIHIPEDACKSFLDICCKKEFIVEKKDVIVNKM